MNDAEASTMNQHLQSIAKSLADITEMLAKQEKRAQDKAAKKALKRANQPLKK